ncbi:glycosyl hydrolase 115 family protein [Zobellia roscoffensis]|uniref:glycosyl hydrolase 115 family protein n=1 Tax=Zobellia roscoffensis TaxID=2779508 RepID=UPI00188CE07A|nr:glycosyl hydrolase 115 family protein [Zobellia roscoffensis]
MKHKLNRVLLVIVGLIFFQCTTTSDEFVISGEVTTSIFISSNEPEYVQLAAKDLIDDIELITGITLKTVTYMEECKGNCIVIGTVGDSDIRNIIDIEKISALEGAWEKFVIFSSKEGRNNRLNIIGGNPRGTMFGIYYFLEKELGVDPLKYWTGYEPEKREKIILQPIDYKSVEPDFKFRGWFINDEDLLTEFKDSGGIRKIDYPYYGQVTNPVLIREVAKAAVRLRYNLIIPASFLDIRNPAEERLIKEVSKRGLFISMHHIEPVGVSAFGYQNYWKEKEKNPLFSFYSEKEKLIETWTDYAKRWAIYPDVIWQIGLRGIADRPMWQADPGVPQSDEERAAIISDAMKVQKEIIMNVTGNQNPLMSTTLWAEGAFFHQEGLLKIPDNVMIIFADNSPGYVWQSDFYDTERSENNKYGIYYHYQLWGAGPHLAQAIPPSKPFQLFKEAMDRNTNEYAILNVSNIREFPLALQTSSDMFWNMDSFEPSEALKAWCANRFSDAPEETYAAYSQYFDSYQKVGNKQIPGFLDGQQRIKGLSILGQLNELLVDGHAQREEQAKQTKSIKVKDAFHLSLSDTNPAGGLPLDESLEKVNLQLAGFEKAKSLAVSADSKLAGMEKDFFESNLIGQVDIVIGLGQWLENCIYAKQAADNRDWETTRQHLRTALNAFEVIDSGKQKASKGKWKNWYRGDKKMNINALKERTKEVLKSVGEKM